jgi:DNA-binding NarL/FixJ family response regulator
MKQLTVLLCDDHTLVREGLRLLLDSEADIKVVGEATNGHRAVGETKRLKPDVVLMDLAMPLLNGLEAARQIAKEVPSAKVLILSAYTDDHYIEAAVEVGAAGYLTKETAGDDLLRAIREVVKGNAFFSPPVARRLLTQCQEKFSNGCSVGTRGTLLSTRQTEVLQLIAEGYATKQIADVLSLSIKTVEKHRQDLMNTLNIHNVATLTRYAVSSGVVESNCVPNGSITSAPRADGCPVEITPAPVAKLGQVQQKIPSRLTRQGNTRGSMNRPMEKVTACSMDVV